MKLHVFALLSVVVLGCGAKAPTNPLGGPVNTGGKPDVNKTQGTVDTGGAVNTGGKPDVNKTQGTLDTGGPVNTGGKPDVDKSLKSTPGGKDAGAK